MRLLRYPGPLLASVLMVPLACTTIIQQPPDDNDDDDTTTTNTPDDTTTTGETTVSPPDDTTTTGADSGSGTEGSSSDEGSQGQLCGNGIIEGTELCDCGGMPCSPAGLGGNMCAGLTNPMFPTRYYTGGILDCSPASCQFVFTQCSYCGDGALNGNEICEGNDKGPSCQDLGLGSGTSDLPCGPQCQWYVECCDPDPPEDC